MTFEELQSNFPRYYSIAAPRTLVSKDRCWVLAQALWQTLDHPGVVMECGVYKGGTAAMLAAILADAGSSRELFLFDTFSGMPETDPVRDKHRKGDFANTTLAEVAAYVGHPTRCIYRAGFLPDTFVGLEHLPIAFCHVDVDIYRSVWDCLEFCWPRLTPGGAMLFDDYGFPSCPGAREAVDVFCRRHQIILSSLPTRQAVIAKSAAPAPHL